jgi:hypothetical protein
MHDKDSIFIFICVYLFYILTYFLPKNRKTFQKKKKINHKKTTTLDFFREEKILCDM